jgi:hypothetical protein
MCVYKDKNRNNNVIEALSLRRRANMCVRVAKRELFMCLFIFIKRKKRKKQS